MNSKTLIEQVTISVGENWEGSDLWSESETKLEKMAAHMKNCEECRIAFDVQDYPEEHLIDFERRIQNTDIAEWVCGNE